MIKLYRRTKGLEILHHSMEGFRMTGVKRSAGFLLPGI